MSRISDYFSEELNRYKVSALLIFIAVITALAWQSDDSYHAYIMAKNLVDGNGFVYNIGQRSTASTCPLYTLVIAAGYFVIRDMFFVSLLINIVFSAIACHILLKYFCRTKKQIVFCLFVMIGSVSFISYTTSGLENSMLNKEKTRGRFSARLTHLLSSQRQQALWLDGVPQEAL